MSAQIGFQKEPIDIQGGKVPFRGGGEPPKTFRASRETFLFLPPLFC